MLDRMRLRLALYFMCLVLVLHALGAATSIVLLRTGLDRSVDSLLADLLSEIRPSIQVQDRTPTLRLWADKAEGEKLPILATIQVYDTAGHVLEQYGPPGVVGLATGRVAGRVGGNTVAVQSRYEPIIVNGSTCGSLQVQAYTKENDRAADEALDAALLVMPFLGGMVAVAGYIFAGVALRPVNDTMKMLRRFVADAGHELNTPIAVIEASLETLQPIISEHKVEEDCTETIAKASARMSELASDLVFLARVEDPLSAYPMAPLRIDKLVDEAVRDFLPLAESRGIALECTPVQAVEITGNTEFLKRMLTNLLSNALRYTDAGGKVTVSVDVEGSRLHIKTSDTGMGIPPESLDHIFERFYRVDKARSRAAGGAGLGLSIVKGVVEIHEGTIEVASEVGKGSSFLVTLPLPKR